MFILQIDNFENHLTQSNFESTEIEKLEKKLLKKNELIKALKLQLKQERSASNKLRSEDTELINMLRIKLTEALELKDKLVMKRQNIENFFNKQSVTEVSGE